jgi:hypothetical protein
MLAPRPDPDPDRVPSSGPSGPGAASGFSRAELIAACLPEGEVLERTVDSHISKLRRKLEEVGVEGVP